MPIKVLLCVDDFAWAQTALELAFEAVVVLDLLLYLSDCLVWVVQFFLHGIEVLGVQLTDTRRVICPTYSLKHGLNTQIAVDAIKLIN